MASILFRPQCVNEAHCTDEAHVIYATIREMELNNRNNITPQPLVMAQWGMPAHLPTERIETKASYVLGILITGNSGNTFGECLFTRAWFFT